MKIIIISFCLCLLLCFSCGTAHKNIHHALGITTIIFFPTIAGDKLELVNDERYFHNEEPLEIETLKFYISNIGFEKNNKNIYRELNSFHLLNAASDSLMQIVIKTKSDADFDALTFNLGLDSLTNVSGALGGDLDPTKGMYWTWQSGYIHFKLEGKSPLSTERNNRFQFHLGGYTRPSDCLAKVRLPLSQSDTIYIDMDISKYLSNIDLAQQKSVMSPSYEAKNLFDLAAEMFSIDE